MTPLTPAGQALDTAWEALSDALDLWQGMTPATREWKGYLLARYRPAIERQAAERALAELRREVEGLPGRITKPGPFGTALAWPMEPQEFRLAVLALIDKASKPEEGA